MRISDWSSDVCSSDLADPADDHQGPARRPAAGLRRRLQRARLAVRRGPRPGAVDGVQRGRAGPELQCRRPDRKSVVSGKSVSVRVDLGGRRIIKKKTPLKQTIATKSKQQ